MTEILESVGGTFSISLFCQYVITFISHIPSLPGAKDMWRAYSDMREANYKGADKYFHARGNYDAARRGPGGAWAARVISDAREGIQRLSGHGAADSRADQAANRWGRSGKDPNHFRPAGLPKKY
ncbi:serum amyloid A-5 protein [Pteropus alecto]|nr:serum amyloid A-5 protein [Pteropus alecto]